MPPRTPWRDFIDGVLDAAQDQLARRATLPGGSLMQAAMQIARQVNAGADRILLHRFQCIAISFATRAGA